MRSPALTLFGSLWGRSRTILLIVLIGIAGAYALLWLADARGLRPDAGEASEDFIVAVLLISLPALVAAAAVVLVNSDTEQLSIAVPTRLLRLPLATWKLSLVLVAFGMLAVGGVALAGMLPALALLNVDFPWWVPVLAAAPVAPLVQLWAFAFGNASPRVALVSFVLYFGVVTSVVRQPFFVRLANESAFALNLAVALAFFAVVFSAVWAVIRVQRRGGWEASLPARAVASSTTRARKPFRTARAAQFWYEWRQFGMLLPVYVVGTALAYFLGLPLVVGLFRITDVTGESSAEPLFFIDWFSSAQFITGGVGFAAFVGGLIVGGVLFMRGGHWNSQSNYLLTRPLSLARISNARLFVIASSALLALAGLLALVGSLELFTNLRGDTTGIGFFLHQGYEQLPRWVAVSIFFSGLLLMIWTCAWSTGYVYVLGIAVAIIVPPLALDWLAALVGLQSVDDAKELMAAMLPWLQWAVAGVVLLGYLALAWRANAKRLMHPAVPWVSAAAWLAYSYGFVYYVNRWDAPITANEWYIRFPHPVIWPLWVAASIIPLVPAVLHPLLLERVRHQ